MHLLMSVLHLTSYIKKRTLFSKINERVAGLIKSFIRDSKALL